MRDVVFICSSLFIRYPSQTVRGSEFWYADQLHTSVSAGRFTEVAYFWFSHTQKVC